MSQESNLQRAALFASVAGGLGVLLWNHLSHKGKGIPYPPGPKPLPFLGNILDYPIDYSWLTLDRYAKQYGQSFFTELGYIILILPDLSKGTLYT